MEMKLIFTIVTAVLLSGTALAAEQDAKSFRGFA
jgi:hypothetical protein